MAPGRPTDYRPEMCDDLLDMGRQGYSKHEMAAELGIAWSTFHNWMNRHPEFLDAVKDATAAAQAWWERQGREKTFEKDGMNPTSYIFQMKNRFPSDWRDKRESDHTSSDGSMTPVFKTVYEGKGD